jgi:hypothetical protein
MVSWLDRASTARRRSFFFVLYLKVSSLQKHACSKKIPAVSLTLVVRFAVQKWRKHREVMGTCCTLALSLAFFILTWVNSYHRHEKNSQASPPFPHTTVGEACVTHTDACMPWRNTCHVAFSDSNGPQNAENAGDSGSLSTTIVDASGELVDHASAPPPPR